MTLVFIYTKAVRQYSHINMTTMVVTVPLDATLFLCCPAACMHQLLATGRIQDSQSL